MTRAWHEQLAEKGLLQLPLWLDTTGHAQAIVTLRKEGDRLRSQAVLDGGFMPLREAPGGPLPSPPSSLAANERIDERARPLAHLSGEALRRLSAQRRRRLLSLALSEPRIRRLSVRVPRSAVGLYLALEAPKDLFVRGWPRPGVISEDGRGLALLAGGGKLFTRLESYGDSDAERLLLELIERWKERGRLTGHDLRVEVSFQSRGAGSRVRWSWAR